MLAQQSAMRYAQSLLNPSAQNEDGGGEFSPTRATNHLP